LANIGKRIALPDQARKLSQWIVGAIALARGHSLAPGGIVRLKGTQSVVVRHTQSDSGLALHSIGVGRIDRGPIAPNGTE
jgi:hypothetical protein